MKNLFIVFFCLVSVLAIKANGQESLWKIQAVDYQGTYYGAAVANGGIGILPWKEPFSVRHVMLNHVFDAAAPPRCEPCVARNQPVQFANAD